MTWHVWFNSEWLLECSGIEALKYTLENESHDFFPYRRRRRSISQSSFFFSHFLSLFYQRKFYSLGIDLSHFVKPFCQVISKLRRLLLEGNILLSIHVNRLTVWHCISLLFVVHCFFPSRIEWFVMYAAPSSCKPCLLDRSS